jgi:hypothetical protein
MKTGEKFLHVIFSLACVLYFQSMYPSNNTFAQAQQHSVEGRTRVDELQEHMYFERSDGVSLTLCITVMFFYDLSRPREVRRAILDIFDAHAEYTGDAYHWTQNPITSAWKKLKNSRDSYVHPREWVFDAGRLWSLIYHGGENKNDATAIVFNTLNSGDTPNSKKVNFIYMRMPVAVTKDPQKLAENIRLWCGWLQPLHGYVGYGLGSKFSGFPGPALEEYEIAQLYSGVDVSEPVINSLNLGLGIKGVNWLTILGDKYLNQLGGLTQIKEHMGALPVLAYPGGAVLQAGPRPLLGDVLQNENMDAYKKVAAIVEPVRMKTHSGISVGVSPDDPRPHFNAANYRKWLARFSPQPQ